MAVFVVSLKRTIKILNLSSSFCDRLLVRVVTFEVHGVIVRAHARSSVAQKMRGSVY